MKLTEKLKENVEKNENKEEDVKEITEKAGMKLTDEDMDQVVGGSGYFKPADNLYKH